MPETAPHLNERVVFWQHDIRVAGQIWGIQPELMIIDGYKRIAALEQLARHTVEAVAWPMSEAAAVLLGRSLRLSEHETAFEVGWLLAELQQRFDYGLNELAHRFDRSVSWVSRDCCWWRLCRKRFSSRWARERFWRRRP